MKRYYFELTDRNNVDYMKDGQVWTVICVPEDAIQELR